MSEQSKRKRSRHPVYTVLRIDVWDGDVSKPLSELRADPQRFVTVTAVYPTLDEAKADVERFNDVRSGGNGGSGAVYFWAAARECE
ncbi:hypothetical protein [Tsukamurella paurometabola]|uniref:Uncharacterized protein n=1 Tax=Tsukamurella paurometabola TaxID=2061 RepID=A0ABS5NJ60_TSUPA|nr:hypothetical protein [Tsukamurella paurometabola]MBS4104326.1 hypothetical protein [Tsukamurella paurometabola]